MSKKPLPFEDGEFLLEIIKDLIQEVNSELLEVSMQSQSEMNEFKRKLKKIFNEYKKDFGPEFEKELEKVYNEEFQETESKLIDFNNPEFRIPSKRFIDFNYGLKKILEGAEDSTNDLFENGLNAVLTSINRYQNRVSNELLQKITSGATQGAGADEITERVIALLKKEGIKGFNTIDKNGDERMYSLQATAKYKVRSFLVQSRQRAVIAKCLERGHDLIQVSSHGDPSPMCQPHQGRIYSISGQTKGYPLLDTALWDGAYKKGSGVGWPYCRHTFLVFFE